VVILIQTKAVGPWNPRRVVARSAFSACCHNVHLLSCVFICCFVCSSVVCCVHLLVWLFGLICVKISTLFGFHQSLRSLTFLIRLEIVLEMCSIQACSFQIASDGFWACNFPGCIGKFVTYFSFPGLLCSSLGVVDHSDLCSFLLQRASIEPTTTLCAAVCLTEVTLSIPICVAISNAHSRAGSCFSHTSCSGSCHTCCLMGDCLGLDCLTYCSPIGVVKGHICC